VEKCWCSQEDGLVGCLERLPLIGEYLPWDAGTEEEQRPSEGRIGD
jgi:hypothetical protein